MPGDWKSAIIINDRVKHSGMTADASVDQCNLQSLSTHMDYILRREEYALKGPIDTRLTREDIRLEYEKSLNETLKPQSNPNVKDLIDYNARLGSFRDRNIEIPFSNGEVSGGLWDINGVCDPDRVIEDICRSGSNVVTSVVSIRRDMAPLLNMTTKEDWQRAMREIWMQRVGEWGIIAPQDIRCCFSFHTDNPVNIHVHVVTWDDSGRFTGSQRIPKATIQTSQACVRREILREFNDMRIREKSALRDVLVAQLKVSIGQWVDPVKLEHLKESCLELRTSQNAEIRADFQKSKDNDLKELLNRAAQHMPVCGFGRAGYAFQSHDAKAAVNLAIMQAKRSDQEFARNYERYKALCTEGGDILGRRGHQLDEYVKTQMSELDDRLRNVVSKKAAALNSPWLKSPAVNTALAELMQKAPGEINGHVVYQAKDEIKRTGFIENKTYYIAMMNLLNKDQLSHEISTFKKEALNYCSSKSSRPLTEKQRDFLKKKIDRSLKTEVVKRIPPIFVNKVVQLNRNDLARTTRKTLSPHSGQKLQTREKPLVEKSIMDLGKTLRKDDFLSTGLLSQQAMGKLLNIREYTMSQPEISGILKANTEFLMMHVNYSEPAARDRITSEATQTVDNAIIDRAAQYSLYPQHQPFGSLVSEVTQALVNSDVASSNSQLKNMKLSRPRKLNKENDFERQI